VLCVVVILVVFYGCFVGDGELGREEGANGFWVCEMVKRGD
jgi:hypothetical protein